MTTIHRISAGARADARARAHRRAGFREDVRAQRERLVRPGDYTHERGPRSDVSSTNAMIRASSATDRAASRRASGFDWGDAGIGAAGGLALAMVGSAERLPCPKRRAPAARASPATAIRAHEPTSPAVV